MSEMKYEVELVDGTKKIITLRPLTRGEMKMVSEPLYRGKKIKDPNQPLGDGISFLEMAAYQDDYLLSSIKAPEEAKSKAFLESLPDTTFTKLFNFAREINGEGEGAVEIEKK